MSPRLLAAALICCLSVLAILTPVVVAQGPGIPKQIAYIKASNPGMFDHFGEGGALDGHIGNAVAVSGDGNTIAVGAQHESSNARGVNGNQNNDAAYSSGAVYVFAAQRWLVDAAGVRESLEPGKQRPLRQRRRVER